MDTEFSRLNSKGEAMQEESHGIESCQNHMDILYTGISFAYQIKLNMVIHLSNSSTGEVEQKDQKFKDVLIYPVRKQTKTLN